MSHYKVKQGDCLASIADKYGFFWKTIWNHPENRELKKKRKDHNVLFTGDKVFIPDKDPGEESCPTEKKHRFRKKGIPIKFRIRLMENDEPLEDVEYTLELDEVKFDGVTGKDGIIECDIPPSVQQGRLFVGPERMEYEINLGYLDPVDTTEGVQARLNNLGFDCGEIDGEPGPKTEAALRLFQSKYDLEVTGKPDESTCKKLEEIHGN